MEPPCSGGVSHALAETLPWHVRYASFAGTLPRITRIRIQIIELQFTLIFSGITCLIKSTPANPAVLDVGVNGSGEAATLTLLPEFPMLVSGTFCQFGGNATGEGTAEVFTLITPQRRITVRLVQ